MYGKKVEVELKTIAVLLRFLLFLIQIFCV